MERVREDETRPVSIDGVGTVAWGAHHSLCPSCAHAPSYVQQVVKARRAVYMKQAQQPITRTSRMRLGTHLYGYDNHSRPSLINVARLDTL